MNVLSLFDGMSCGMIALERSGFKINNYYASEIDKYAMKVSAANYPDIIQLGDVRKVTTKGLPKIDLLIGGSPCQGFSLAGKQLNFNDPRSMLFFEFVRLLKEVREKNPDVYFMLENVKMRKDYQDIISEYMGCNPIVINSALLSAQNRLRLYWTNIPVVGLPEDRKIFLKDILEDEVADKYYLSNKMIKCLEGRKDISKSYAFIPKSIDKKAVCLVAKEGQYSTCTFIENEIITHNLQKREAKGLGGKGHLQKTDQISYCLDTANGQAIEKDYRIRRLTPIECEKLQTVPDNYTNHVSDTQRYRMLGNGWTVDVIAWIFQFMNEEKREEIRKNQKQTTLFDMDQPNEA